MGAGDGCGAGSGGAGEVCPGLLWSFLWFLIFWFLAWPLAFCVAWFYVLLLPLSGCMESLQDTCEALLKVVQLPLACVENMLAMKPLWESV